MSTEELLAEILRLPTNEQRGLVENVIDHWPESVEDSDMTPELRAKLESRIRDMEENPNDEMTWEELESELDLRESQRRMGQQ